MKIFVITSSKLGFFLIWFLRKFYFIFLFILIIHDSQLTTYPKIMALPIINLRLDFKEYIYPSLILLSKIIWNVNHWVIVLKKIGYWKLQCKHGIQHFILTLFKWLVVLQASLSFKIILIRVINNNLLIFCLCMYLHIVFRNVICHYCHFCRSTKVLLS